ncbi:MAG: hypothetical protein L0G94_06285 [Brachybacterium sp.]|uniref:hypothetical protein n=1 Tax=Brachybacterium sp. TaxID=1891286 RepID=UPI00264721B6|nr:hypothetical protein [Brachybacterium sp.]MDN5686281.1 hypothetical protein [Brachybacterium sp.]
MRFTRSMADAFGDQLEQDRIQQALVAARPELTAAIRAGEHRPLLRILDPRGGAVLVAKTSDGPSGPRWVVGVPGSPAPVIHEPGSCEGIVDVVLRALDRHGDDGSSDT